MKAKIIKELLKHSEFNIKNPKHPGEILRELFIDSNFFESITFCSISIDIFPQKLSKIMRKKQDIDKQTCIKIGNYFNICPSKIMMFYINYRLYLINKERGNNEMQS